MHDLSVSLVIKYVNNKYINYDTHILIFLYFYIILGIMNGYTVAELSSLSGLTTYCVKQRLRRAGIKPTSKAGPTSIYGNEAIEVVKKTIAMGRPKKTT